MGNGFFTLRGRWDPDNLTPDVIPQGRFDPLYGFPNGRKERVMIATVEEMEAAKIPLDLRDYCAHLFIELLRCNEEQFPWYIACAPEKHKLNECQYEDFVIRMKEFERERRLRARDHRKRQKEMKENLE